MSELLRNIIRFVVVMVIQVFLFSQIQLFGYAMAFIYIFFILFLPVYLPKWQVLLLSVLAGITIDILLGTSGLHTAVATLLGFMRPFILKWVTPQYDTDDDVFLNIYGRNVVEYSTYAILSSLIFCSAFFILERFGTGNILQTVLYIISSTIFTFIALLIFRYLFVGKANTTRH